MFGTKPLTPATARSAAIVNLVVTPGLGTLMAGQWISGLGQFALALGGFGLMMIWFVKVMFQYYGQITGNPDIKPVGWIGWIGLACFSVAWVWSLVTSISLFRQASRMVSKAAQPPMAIPPLQD